MKKPQMLIIFSIVKPDGSRSEATRKVVPLSGAEPARMEAAGAEIFSVRYGYGKEV